MIEALRFDTWWHRESFLYFMVFLMRITYHFPTITSMNLCKNWFGRSRGISSGEKLDLLPGKSQWFDICFQKRGIKCKFP